MEWVQAYDPLHQAWLSTIVAALPIVLLLVTLGLLEWKAHWAALGGLVTALVVSTAVYGRPVSTALGAAIDGAAYGLFPIGWIVLTAVFLDNLTVAARQACLTGSGARDKPMANLNRFKLDDRGSLYPCQDSGVLRLLEAI